MRFAIRRGAWRPLLAAMGGTAARSWVELAQEDLTLSFGLLEETIPLSDVERVRRGRWPVWGGIGWKIGPGTLGLIGALSGIVEIELNTWHRTRVMLIPLEYRRVYVSLEQADGFVEQLTQLLGGS